MRITCGPSRFPIVGDVLLLVKRLAWLAMIVSLGIAKAGELRTIAELRRLSREESQKNPPALIRGTVTFVTVFDDRAEATVQDATEGIYTYFKTEDAARLQLEDLVEIKGYGDEGAWAPCLRAVEVTILGKGGLPEAKRTDYPALKSSLMDSQLVEIEGMVRDVQYDSSVAPPSTILTVSMPGGRAEVFKQGMPDDHLLGLVDSKVRVTGVPFQYFNQRRQAFEFRLMVTASQQITTVDLPPSPAFDLPVTPLGQLLQYDPKGHSEHRIRARGVVILHWPGEFLFLQDGDDGLLVRSRRTEALKPGDLVDVVAFATMGPYAAFLEDAEFRKIDSGRVPEVMPIALEDLATGDADARLVETQGVLESVSERNGRAYLMIRKGNLIVPAELPVAMEKLPPILPGSIVRVTGVCQVELGPQRRFAIFYRPESAKLLMRSADDVKVMRSAPWWTEKRLSMALTALVAVLGLAGVWLWSLQSRNVRLQREIGAREKAEAEVKRREEERSLLAADLHDSLEQSLTGVALQLQAAGRVKENHSPHLDLAERLLKYSREEVHRAVRDLRQPANEIFDPRQAIRDLVKRSEAASDATFQVDLPDSLPELPGHLSHHLLHLAQEGVTNALKHAEATLILISLKLQDGRIHFELTDNGKGFDTLNRPGVTDGHFGLQGMKERVARLGGKLEIDSKVGDGTRIKVMLPLES